MDEIEIVKKNLPDWVAKGRELKAKFLLVVLDNAKKQYYPVYIFNDNVQDAWDNTKKPLYPIISFNLNKKVFGVDV